MRLRTIISFVVLLCFAAACQVTPEAIDYSGDTCAYCKMQISDARFGAELVTKKGRVSKYDSAECLFNTIAAQDPTEFQYILVTDYTRPGTLIDARQAAFLVSPKRQSPMGENLSAYGAQSTARAAMQELGGDLYSYEEIATTYDSAR